MHCQVGRLRLATLLVAIATNSSITFNRRKAHMNSDQYSGTYWSDDDMISARSPRLVVAVAWAILMFVSWPVHAAETYVLGKADTMSKVFRDAPGMPLPMETLNIEAARNEIEGIQLLVAPVGAANLHGLMLETSDLLGEAGRRSHGPT